MEGGFVKEDQTILAKLSQASYKQPAQETVGNWTLVHRSPNVALYVNNEGVPIISVRGTKPTDTADLYADSQIPLNKLGTTDRYKADYKTIKSWSAGKPFFAVGHSLGSAIIDELIDDGLVSEAVTFNGAIQPKHINAGLPNMRIYMKGDPLYTLFGQWDKNSIMVSKKSLNEGIRDALLNLTNIGSVVAAVLSHKLTSFTGEGMMSKMEKQIHEKRVSEQRLAQLRQMREQAQTQQQYDQLNNLIQNVAKPNIEQQHKKLKEYLYQYDVKLHGKGEQKDRVKKLKSDYSNRVVADVLKTMTDEVLEYIDALNRNNVTEQAAKLAFLALAIGSWFTPASAIAGIPTTVLAVAAITNITNDEKKRTALKKLTIDELEESLKELATLTPLQQRTWLLRRKEEGRRRFDVYSKQQHPHSKFADIEKEIKYEASLIHVPDPYRTSYVSQEPIKKGTKMVRYHALDLASSSSSGGNTYEDRGVIGHIPESEYEGAKGKRNEQGRMVGEKIDTYLGKGVQTHKKRVQKKLKLKPNGYSIEELAVASGVPVEILQEVYNRGIGAYKTNPTSVRMKGTFKKGVKAPMSQKLSKEQWGMARVYSFLDGNKKHDNDLRK